MCTERASVYVIVHLPSGRMYVGSTANTSKRWSRHRQELRAGRHRNKHLQATWSRDGEEAFAWRVLAIVEPTDRVALEQRVLDRLRLTDPQHGFNRAAVAGVSYGGTGHAWTPEARAKCSASNRAAKPPQPVGSLCVRGHVKDGSYVRVRANGTVSIRCQECERTASRERARAYARARRGLDTRG